MDCPKQFVYWTADEIENCIDPTGEYDGALTEEQWHAVMNKLAAFTCEAIDAGTATPLGGDGSNGTVETPDGRLDPANTDKAPHWWHRLEAFEQRAYCLAYNKEDKRVWGGRDQIKLDD